VSFEHVIRSTPARKRFAHLDERMASGLAKVTNDFTGSIHEHVNC
jgi:hypothetical protein